MLSADLHRGQQAGDRAGREHRVDDRPLGEPVIHGPFDARSDALERQLKILDAADRHAGLQQARSGRLEYR